MLFWWSRNNPSSRSCLQLLRRLLVRPIACRFFLRAGRVCPRLCARLLIIQMAFSPKSILSLSGRTSCRLRTCCHFVEATVLCLSLSHFCLFHRLGKRTWVRGSWTCFWKGLVLRFRDRSVSQACASFLLPGIHRPFPCSLIVKATLRLRARPPGLWPCKTHPLSQILLGLQNLKRQHPHQTQSSACQRRVRRQSQRGPRQSQCVQSFWGRGYGADCKARSSPAAFERASAAGKSTPADGQIRDLGLAKRVFFGFEGTTCRELQGASSWNEEATCSEPVGATITKVSTATSKKRPAAATSSSCNKRPAGRERTVTREQRLQMKPQGCSRCRWVPGCCRSCWVKRSYTVLS